MAFFLKGFNRTGAAITNVVRLMNFINFDTDSSKTYLAEEKHVDSYGKAQGEDPAEKKRTSFF